MAKSAKGSVKPALSSSSVDKPKILTTKTTKGLTTGPPGKSNTKKVKGKSGTTVKIPQSTSDFSANWKLLSKAIQPKYPIKPRKPKPISNKNTTEDSMEQVESSAGTTLTQPGSKKPKKPPLPKAFLNKIGCIDYTHYGQLVHGTVEEIPDYYKAVTRVLAIDCEMVGVGSLKEDALARVSIVNEHGFVLLDAFVKPKLEITDYRTEFSGVREEDMLNAITLNQAMSKVCELIKGKILVGHSVDKDLGVLFINHPQRNLRDTARYFRHRGRSPSLKTLAERYLKVEIQTGEHSSIQDAQATIKVYLMHQKAWEKSLEEKRFRHR